MARVVAVLAVLVAVVSAQQASPLSKQGTRIVSTNYGSGSSTASAPVTPATKSPQIVSSLNELHTSNNAPKPKNWSPLPYPNNDEHKWVSQMKSLQKEIEDHETSLDDLNKELHEAQARRAKLKHAQKLLHSMVALHQSELVLGKLDGRIEAVKAAIKKLGDEAEEAMRGRDDLKEQMEEEMKKKAEELAALRAKLARHESMLTALSSKRSEVAQTVTEWRDFVDNMRSANGLPTKGDGITIPALPRPPSEESGEATEEEAEAEGSEAVGGGSGGSGSEAEEESRKAPEEVVKAEETDEKTDLDTVTAEAHEIKATHDSIQELLNVHLPRITGKASSGKAAAASFLQTQTRLRQNRHK